MKNKTMYGSTYDEYSDEKIDSGVSYNNELKYPGVVCNSYLVHLREKPNIISDSLSILERGRKVTILEMGTEWHKIEVDGLIGYISSKYCEEV